MQWFTKSLIFIYFSSEFSSFCNFCWCFGYESNEGTLRSVWWFLIRFSSGQSGLSCQFMRKQFLSKLLTFSRVNIFFCVSRFKLFCLNLKKTLTVVTGSRSTFEFPSRVNLSVPSCTVPSSMDMTSRCNKVDAVRLFASYRLNLLLLQGAEDW